MRIEAYFGTISSFGVFPLSVTLDTVGILARTMDDLEFVLTNLLPEKFGQAGSYRKTKGETETSGRDSRKAVI